jgi:branched-chain amino acid transport system permease protein
MSSWFHVHQVLVQQSAIFVLMAMSFQVVLRSGVFSFASIGFFGIGGYAVANMAKHGIPTVANLLVVTFGAFAAGYLMSLPLVRLRGLYLGMVTFAFDQIIVVVGNNGGKLTGGPVGLYGVPLDVDTTDIIIAAVLGVLLISQLERRSLGRSLEALRTDENLARSLGVEVKRQRSFIFALSASLGALSGGLYVFAFSTFAPVSFGFDLLVSVLTMAVIGGVSSWLGAAIGAIFVTWFPDLFHFVGSWKSLVYGVLIIVVVVYEPNGILGLVDRGLSAAVRLRRRVQAKPAQLAGGGVEHRSTPSVPVSPPAVASEGHG